MSERGKLIYKACRAAVIRYTNKKLKEVDLQLKTGETSHELVACAKGVDSVDVEFDLVDGQPKQVRRPGERFASNPSRANPARVPDPPRGTRGNHQPDRGDQPRQQSPRAPEHFHNPYNFVPTPPRRIDDPDLGDHAPAGHDRYAPDLVSGRISVRMTAVTPVLSLDTARGEAHQGHHTYDTRLGVDGRPEIATTSIKGALRSAYEAVTNSRFGIWSRANRQRLGYRMEAREGLGLVPARVENGRVALYLGTSSVGQNGPAGPMYAAWLPRYDVDRRQPNQSGPNISQDAIRQRGELPAHGVPLTCWIEKVMHPRRGFVLWRVRQIGGARPPGPSESAEVREESGYACVTNQNINGKHDERLFFGRNGDHTLTGALRDQWRGLIHDYQNVHHDALANTGRNPTAYLGREPGKTAFSRHTYGQDRHSSGITQAEMELAEGTLCYAELSNGQVRGLYPVMIARRVYDLAPDDLLDSAHRPARSTAELSPADRVFGWVNSSGQGAYRGQLRMSALRCVSDSADAVKRFATPVLLAILGQPKPAQGRFYVGDSSGAAQPDGLTKRLAGYSSGKRLRGRKVYPHHAGLPASHWENPERDRTQQVVNGHHQEYRRPDAGGRAQPDNQSRSIKSWIAPGAQFDLDIEVVNLSQVEIGALLWLLSLPVDHYHRIGGGKPLGFGSVRLALVSHELRTGDDLRQHFMTFSGSSANASSAKLVGAFQAAVANAYGNGTFTNVDFIRAWLRSATGHSDGLPTHYPRLSTHEATAPSPEGESFRWFVENERNQKAGLADLANDSGLPHLFERIR